jgi:hypothetical protein
MKAMVGIGGAVVAADLPSREPAAATACDPALALTGTRSVMV